MFFFPNTFKKIVQTSNLYLVIVYEKLIVKQTLIWQTIYSKLFEIEMLSMKVSQ